MDDDLQEIRIRLDQYIHEEMDEYMNSARFEGNEVKAFKVVGQALLWVCSLDEFYLKNCREYEEFRRDDDSSSVIKGIRYARNRALHQFTQLLFITEGAELPAELPMPLFEIRWRLASDLPEPDQGYWNEKLEQCYKDSLQNQSVRFTFDSLRGYFERASNAFREFT